MDPPLPPTSSLNQYPPLAGLVFSPVYLWMIIISFINLFIYLFIYGCVGSSSLRVGFSLVVASGGYSSLRCAGFSLRWLLLLQSTGSRRAGFSSCGTRAQ